MLRIKYRAARPKLRATEQRADGAPRGAPKKRPWTAIRGAEIAARARPGCQTDIEGRGAAHWRGPPGRPEKAALDRYSGLLERGPPPLYRRAS